LIVKGKISAAISPQFPLYCGFPFERLHSGEKSQKQYYRKKSIKRTPIYWGWLLLPKSYETVPIKKPAPKDGQVHLSFSNRNF
jgi:hypothetical protein